MVIPVREFRRFESVAGSVNENENDNDPWRVNSFEEFMEGEERSRLREVLNRIQELEDRVSELEANQRSNEEI